MGCGCRGRGGAGGCQCAVEAGANVNVTGTGTPGDPWVIAAAGEISDTLIQVSDTATLNLSISGDGSVGDPYIISGVVNNPGTMTVQDTDTLNLTLTGSGTTADPWVISGVVDIDVTVQDTTTLDLTITGTGTDADPYVISGEVTPTEVAVDNAAPGGITELALDGSGAPGDPWTISAVESIIAHGLRYVIPKVNSGTLDVLGTTTASATPVGSGVAYDATTHYGRIRKMEFLAAAPATNAVGGYRNTDPNILRGNAAGVGGFYVKQMGGPATGVATASHRFFHGLTALTSAPTDVEPSSLVDMIGIGYDSADTNLQLMHNDSAGSATKVDLGASFPVPTVDRTNLYTVELWAAPNESAIHYRVTDLISGAVASGSVNSNLPTATTALTLRGYVSAGGTSSAAGLAFGGYLVNSSEALLG